MKKIELKITDGKIQGQDYQVDYQVELTKLIGVSEQGLSLADMHKIDKVFDKLEKADCPGYVLLEDAEHELLKARCENPKFAVFCKELMYMCDVVVDAPEHLVDAKTA